MDDHEKEYEALERILNDTEADPIVLSYEFLKKITKDFSEVIGSGGFGKVYMGYLQNGKVAVKKLFTRKDFLEKNFQEELKCLKRVKHKNIVRFLGYCSETPKVPAKYNGTTVMADDRRRVLCFEYVRNQSLQHYLEDKSHRHEWGTHYKLIEGVCHGLRYLHNEQRISHLDLKPENILLDHDMVPKITDFGLARCFGGEQSRIITETICGTWGYIPPERFDKGEISFNADIFSLGITIMKLLTGSTESANDCQNWHQSINTDDPLVKRYIKIVQLCQDDDPRQRPTIDNIIAMLAGMETVIEIVRPFGRNSTNNPGSSLRESRVLLKLLCRLNIGLPGLQLVRSMPGKMYGLLTRFRYPPMSAKEISGSSAAPSPLQRIPSTELCYDLIGSSETSCKLLDIHPLELRLPFEPNKRIQRPLTLTNMTNQHVAVWIMPTDRGTRFKFLLPNRRENNPSCYCAFLFHRMEPHSTCVVAMTMKMKQKPPPQDTASCMFEVVMVVGSEDLCKNMEASFRGNLKLEDNKFFKRVDKFSGEVNRAMLTAVVVCDGPAACSQSQEPMRLFHKFMPAIPDYGEVKCIDVHPEKTWMLVGYEKAHVSIWNYQMQERVALQVVRKAPKRLSFFNRTCRIRSAKFIAGEHWFAAGLEDGCVLVYSYTTTDDTTDKAAVKELEAHPGKPVTLLAVHPTKPFLLTASDCDTSIKLWNWSKGWMCAQTFANLDGGGLQCLTLLDASDINTSSSASSDCGIKVCNIHSSDPITTFNASCCNCCHFYADDNHRYFLVYGCGETNCAIIQDLRTKEVVHKLDMTSLNMYGVACHPTLPIIATRGSGDLCLWDRKTYRLEKVVQLKDPIEGMVFTSTEDIARLVVPCKEGISIVEIILPMLKTGGASKTKSLT